MALRGIKVIEMAGLAPAPFCGLILSDFGARVIRVDKPGSMSIDRLSRGKQSISINLKKEEGVDVLKRLCKGADVLIEPFRPGVMERLGLGPEVLTVANPKLVYARLTGYGQSGTMAQKAGHDINYIALSGMLSKFGRKTERPYAPINFAADFAGGGAICALGIVMALYERSISGKGQVIDANMVEGSAYIGNWIDTMRDLLFQGNRGENMLDGGAAFYDTYETKDGKYMAVGALEPQFYAQLLQGLGLVYDGLTQSDDQEKQREVFKKVFLTKTQDEWTEVFKDLDACVNAVLTTDEAIDHPHNKDKGSFNTQSGFTQAIPAPRLGRTPGITEQRPLPKVGQHTLEVLAESGFTQDEINSLVKDGAITSNAKL